jgi:hypothetical protein
LASFQNSTICQATGNEEEPKMSAIELSKPVLPVSYEPIRELVTPAAWPMNHDELEARRREAEKILGRPFPKRSREELSEQKVYDLKAGWEWSLLDALRHGFAPQVTRL